MVVGIDALAEITRDVRELGSRKAANDPAYGAHCELMAQSGAYRRFGFAGERKDSNNELLPTVRVIVPSKLDISSLAAVVILSLVKSKAH